MQNAESSNSRRSRFTSVLASFEAKISAPQTSLKPATGRLSNGTLASPRNRLHRLGHRNVTTSLRTRWFTPAGLCVSARKFGAFPGRQTSLVPKPLDLPTHESRAGNSTFVAAGISGFEVPRSGAARFNAVPAGWARPRFACGVLIRFDCRHALCWTAERWRLECAGAAGTVTGPNRWRSTRC
jgi:hypothetical protein